jgi:Flp pilus assembly protein TadD
MKKLIFVFACCAMVSACSTAGKKEEGSSEESYTQKNESSNSKSDSQGRSESSRENHKKSKEEVARGSANLFADLKAAIMTKDDISVEKSTAQILSSDPDDVKALNAMAMHHAQKGRYSLAEFILEKAEKIEGNSHVVYNNLGVINFQQGKKREAVGYFKKALNVKSNYGVAAANLGSYFADVRDYGKARYSLEIAYKAGIKDINTLNNYAISLMATGESAEEIFDLGMQTGSTSVNFLVNYCIYLVEVKKDLGKAKSILEKINFMGPEPERKETVRSLDKKINGAQIK